MAPGQVFFQYFGFSCLFSFHQTLHTHVSSGAGTIGQLVADVPSGHSLPPPPQKYKRKKDSLDLRLPVAWFLAIGTTVLG
jgi:hypothetical protein